MRSLPRLPALLLATALTAVPLGVACGGRTALRGPAPAQPEDAGGDVAELDAGMDAPRVVFDAPIDVPFPDVTPIDICPDAGSTLIYLITAQNDLYSFYPPTLGFQLIGPITCASRGLAPYSMAVDRRGIGYALFWDAVNLGPGSLFLVDMATAGCKPTSFVRGQSGFGTFGMGFVANAGDAGETLFVAEGDLINAPKPSSLGLATIDTTTFGLSYVAPFTPPLPAPELTGTGAGELFGFYTNAQGGGSHVVQIDPATGAVMTDYPLQVGTPSDAYAFAYWGGVFWVFTAAPMSPTVVTRFDPATRSETKVASLADEVVGAGVSTCAPQ